MTAKRQSDGAVVYRGMRIELNPGKRPGQLGRYSVDGIPFSQLNTAKEYVDVLTKQNLIDLDART